MSEKSSSLINISDLPSSVDNAIKNVTDKPSLAIGTTFADIWELVFGGISYLSEKKKIKYAHKLEVFRKQLEESMDHIPADKKIEPSVQTTAQALENSKYCIDEDNLREMFTALISNSMNIDYQKDTHPSFAEILKQMSPLDAEIIKVFKNSPLVGLPIGRYQINENGGYQTLLENVFIDYFMPDLEACSISISSLTRLGLLKVSYDDILLNSEAYTGFDVHPWFLLLKKNLPDKNVTIHKGIVSLTPLGRSFTRICIPDNVNVNKNYNVGVKSATTED